MHSQRGRWERGKNGLTKADIPWFVTVVPNASVGLIDKQNEGYAYIPVGD
jgi:intracellular sulfur oxidation DsrE/DsrF family protein